MRHLSLVVVLACISNLCLSQVDTLIRLNDSVSLTFDLMYEEHFSDSLSHWAVEQMPEGQTMIKKGKLEIIDKEGCTIWYRHPLTAPLMIRYDAVVIDKGGAQDRVSDLNCFWMAEDTASAEGFWNPDISRTGQFKTYDPLRLYYVGLGGHHNTKTRFRRYVGDGSKPLLPQHDLSSDDFLITPNAVNKIQIIVYKGIIQYWRNNHLIFDFKDADPYQSGYFGFRTVNNHMTVDNFQVYRLKEVDD